MTHIRIGLIDVDSHNFPNLCLMKLSAYHKAQGHQVCFWNPLFYFDVVYKSRVFTDTYSKDNITVRNAGQVIKAALGLRPRPRPAGRNRTQLPGLFPLSAVFRNRLRIFKPWLSKGLRILHCGRQGGPQEPESG